MKIYFLLAGIVLLLTGCENSGKNEIKVISGSDMQTNMKFRNMQVIDVRTKEEYKESHLLNAQNIIYDKNFRKNLAALDKDKPVAIYCTTGKVSPEAAQILKDEGFKNIYILEGGIKKLHTLQGEEITN
ncbi:rhodanese-like domain-containing protein [soil metagenome]